MPPDYRPEAVWPRARTVGVVAVPMLLPIIESTPSINYQEMYDTSNRLLDEISFRLAGCHICAVMGRVRADVSARGHHGA